VESIAAGEIHLWLCFNHEIQDPALLAAYSQLLNEQERAQWQRFYFERDRQQYLVTRALTRSTLSRYVPLPAEAWSFEKLKHGRPRILNPEAGDLTFNLSHTHGLIALAIRRGGELGVDTENISERAPPLEISHRYFSPRETTDLHALPADLRAERFFHYWTLKESYIKARSLGLSIPLDQFSFDCRQETHTSIHFAAELDDRPECWRFWLLAPSQDHLLALCASTLAQHTHTATAWQPMIRRVVPLRTDQPHTIRLLRQSQFTQPTQ
jgi:4'-phosphopantetheinyl transferase